MVGVGVLLLVGVAFYSWDRAWSPVTSPPDMRLVWTGVVLAVIGAVSSVMFWWLVVPVVVLLIGASLIVIGRHHRVSPHVTS